MDPAARKFFFTSSAVLIGIVKPIPRPCPRELIRSPARWIRERAARRAAVDQRVRLDELVDQPGTSRLPWRHDPEGHRPVQPVGLLIAITHSPTRTLSESPKVGKGRGMAASPDQRHVGPHVGADHLASSFFFIPGTVTVISPPVHDVVVREDVPLRP
jgi:hypothetical protein